MQNIFTLLFCAILALITYYDFKYRAVPLYILVIAVIFGMLVSIFKNGFSGALYYAGVNIFLVIIQLVLTTLYFSIRNKKLTNIINSYLGSGDVLFFLVVIFCFSPVNFIIFIILSGLLILIFYAPSKKRNLIPLAGCQSILMCIILYFSNVFKIIQPYNDFFLINL